LEELVEVDRSSAVRVDGHEERLDLASALLSGLDGGLLEALHRLDELEHRVRLPAQRMG